MKINVEEAVSTGASLVVAPKRVAPCGACGDVVSRDLMWSFNPRLFSPSGEETRIQIRLCPECAALEIRELEEMRWDPASLRVER